MIETTSLDRTRRHSRATRRQFLQWASALGTGAVLGSDALASAKPAVAKFDPSFDLSLARQRSREPVPIEDLPLRPVKEAFQGGYERREWERLKGVKYPSALSEILAHTALWESRLGLVNWPVLDETEDPNLGHFNFPLSPYMPLVDDGTQRFMLFSNGVEVAKFRYGEHSGEYREDASRRIFDRVRIPLIPATVSD